jgi:hypothetical protein
MKNLRSFPQKPFTQAYFEAFGLDNPQSDNQPIPVFKKRGKSIQPISFPYRFAPLPIIQYSQATFHLLEEEWNGIDLKKFKIKEKRTIVVPLQPLPTPEEQVVKRMKKFPKTVSFEEIEHWQEALPLLEQTAKRKQYYQSDTWPLMQELWKRLAEQKLLLAFGLKEKEQWQAVQLVILGDNGWLFTYYVGTQPDTKPWSTWLMMCLLEKVSEQGYQYVDLLGANLPTVAQFKKSFGGQFVPYFELTYLPWWRRIL